MRFRLPRLTPFRVLSGLVLSSMCCSLIWWGISALFAQPWIIIPVPGSYTKPNQMICGSGSCHYFAYYQSPQPALQVAQTLEQNGWRCTQILQTDDLNRLFPIKVPYWQCSGKAIPTGFADIGVEPLQGRETQLYILVSWS
jgi:hypothetical protein